jgi:hypothetical protein
MKHMDEKGREFELMKYTELTDSLKRLIEQHNSKFNQYTTSHCKKKNKAYFEYYSSLLYYITTRYANKQFQNPTGKEA